MSHVEESVELTLGQKRRLVARLLREKAGLKRGGPGLVHRLIEMQAARTPESVAVTCSRGSLTYFELNARANRMARRLRGMGVGPEVLVGLCTGRSTEMVVGLLAILKAGGAYVPIDPAYPPDRIKFMLDDARVSVLLTEQRMLDDLPYGNTRVLCLDSEWESADEGRARNLDKPGRWGEPGLCHLHLGVDRQAQRGPGHPRRARQPTAGDAETLADGRTRHSPGGHDALL